MGCRKANGVNSMKYINKKLRNSARFESCSSCGADDGTIVWAHSNLNYHGKGMGTKSHDIFGAYLCRNCHDVYDGRAKSELSKEEKQKWFQMCNENSLITACEKGYL